MVCVCVGSSWDQLRDYADLCQFVDPCDKWRTSTNSDLDKFQQQAIFEHGLGDNLIDVSRKDCTRAELAKLMEVFLSADMPAKLLEDLAGLGFEEQKGVTKLFSAMLRTVDASGTNVPLSTYLQYRPCMLSCLLQGCAAPGISLQCALMLRSCMRDEHLACCLLEQGADLELIDLAQHQSPEVSFEAFGLLHDLLLSHKHVTAKHLKANSETFFKWFNSLLESNEYTTQRQAVKLLGGILLDRKFANLMVAYCRDIGFLKIHMNLLLSTSVRIREDNFHIFKLFVSHLSECDPVAKVLYKNRSRLVRLLQSCYNHANENRAFVEDVEGVIQILNSLNNFV